MKDPFRQLSAEHRERLKRGTARFIEPMRATLTEDHFSDPEWLYERKLDGERILAVRKDGKVRLFTRNRKSASAPYPELVLALERSEVVGADTDFVIDGEVVAFEDGHTSFPLLQRRMLKTDPHESLATGVQVDYLVFDLLLLHDRETLRLPLLQRKALLQEHFDLVPPVRLLDHRMEDGEAYLLEACDRGWEGLIAKRADGTYQTRRSRDWLKFKCTTEQEFVIGGYTDPKGSRVGFGALLLGYHDAAGRLRYAGKVGTGFDTRLLRTILDDLQTLETDRSPFVDDVKEGATHWVRPRRVCEVGFSEWTPEGRLRHPRFKGLRRDKPPKAVTRETATTKT